MKRFDNQFIIAAHRGASAYAPENTMAAFDLAVKMGAHCIECDVQFSKDEKVVVFHDSDVQRTTNGQGLVKDLTFDELKKLDAGFWFSDSFKNERIPALEQLLDFAKSKICLNIEIKPTKAASSIVQAVMQLVRKHKMQEYCILSSFDINIVKTLTSEAPEIESGLIFNRARGRFFKGDWQYLIGNEKQINKKIIAKAKASNKSVLTWTVNNIARMEEIIDIGVDGIITNHPDWLIKITRDNYKNIDF